MKEKKKQTQNFSSISSDLRAIQCCLLALQPYLYTTIKYHTKYLFYNHEKHFLNNYVVQQHCDAFKKGYKKKTTTTKTI